MKISLDAAMRARDVSAPSAADHLAADEVIVEPITAGTDDESVSDEAIGDNRAVSDRSADRPRTRRRARLRRG